MAIQDRTRAAILHITAGAVLISFSGVWVKLTTVSPTISAFYRVFFGALFLLGAAVKNHEIRWNGPRQMALTLLCGLFFALDLLFWHISIQYVGPGLATILGNFQVLLMTAFGVLFLGERIRLRFLLALPMAFTGLFLIVGIHWRSLGDLYKLGVYFGLITAVCYTGFLVVLRNMQAGMRAGGYFYVIMSASFASALFLGLYALYDGDSFAIPDLRNALYLGALGLFSQFLGWMLISNALPRVHASHAGMLLLLQPSLAFVWDVLFFNRPTSMVNWMGVCIALAAIYLGMARGGRPAPPEADHAPLRTRKGAG